MILKLMQLDLQEKKDISAFRKEKAMTVLEVISACEYIGCSVVDFWGNEIEITDENKKDIWRKGVEHLEAKDNVILIHTFDNIPITKENIEAFLNRKEQDKWADFKRDGMKIEASVLE